MRLSMTKTSRPRKEDDRPQGRIQMDNSKAELENRDLDDDLRRQIAKIERSQVHSRFERNEQISLLSSTAKTEKFLSQILKDQEIDRRQEEERQYILAKFGKKLREGTHERADTDEESDDGASFHRSQSRRDRSTPGYRKRRNMSAKQREEHLKYLARPRMNNYLMAAQMLVVRLRSRPRTAVSSVDARGQEAEFEDVNESKKMVEQVRGHFLQKRLLSERAQSAKVEHRVREFCTELQNFAKSSQQDFQSQALLQDTTIRPLNIRPTTYPAYSANLKYS